MATTYEPISTVTLGSAAASITFSSIAATWTDLRIVLTYTGATAGNVVQYKINDDAGTNYSYTILDGSGAAAQSWRNTNQSRLEIENQGGSTTIPTLITTDIQSYAGATYKTLLFSASEDRNGSGFVTRAVALWRSTAAITKIALLYGQGTANFAAGTTATLYGIKAA